MVAFLELLGGERGLEEAVFGVGAAVVAVVVVVALALLLSLKEAEEGGEPIGFVGEGAEATNMSASTEYKPAA